MINQSPLLLKFHKRWGIAHPFVRECKTRRDRRRARLLFQFQTPVLQLTR